MGGGSKVSDELKYHGSAVSKMRPLLPTCRRLAKLPHRSSVNIPGVAVIFTHAGPTVMQGGCLWEADQRLLCQRFDPLGRVQVWRNCCPLG